MAASNGSWRSLSFVRFLRSRFETIIFYSACLPSATITGCVRYASYACKKRTPHSLHFRFDSPPNAKPRRSLRRGRARCPTAPRRRGDTPPYLPLCHSALKNERLEVNVRMNNSTLQLQLDSPTQTQPGGAIGCQVPA